MGRYWLKGTKPFSYEMVNLGTTNYQVPIIKFPIVESFNHIGMGVILPRSFCMITTLYIRKKWIVRNVFKSKIYYLRCVLS